MRRNRTHAAFIIPATLLAASGSAATMTLDRVDLPAGTAPVDVAAGDFDADGDLDLAIVNYGVYGSSWQRYGLRILLNDGAGGFTQSAYYPFPANVSEPNSVVTADLDSDGDLDLGVAIGYAGFNQSAVMVMLNDGAADFSSMSQFPTGYGPASIAATDLDLDDDTDLVTANTTSWTITMLYNDGDADMGDFFTFGTVNYPKRMAFADLDNDGDDDAVETWLHGVIVAKNDGGGGFAGAGSYTAGIRPNAIAFGDLNGSGFNDMVIADYTGGHITAFFNNGDGFFPASTAYTVATGPSDLTIQDLDGDGDADLAITSQSTGRVEFRFNDGEGGLSNAESADVGAAPTSIVVADLNADGNPDVVTTNQDDDSITILLSGATCPADLAEPFGVLDLADIQAFTTAFTSGDPSADLTGEGVLDLQDIAAFVASFTAGCP